jgi:hypothetical protein
MAENTMFEYSEFVDNLKVELNSYKTTPKEEWRETASRYVNGFAAEELRRLVPLAKRRNDGIFFTDSLLAETVLNVLEPSFNEQSVIYDAACGVCNLLIAAANYFHKHNIQPANKNYLLGTDIHAEFVEAANLRLQMNNLLLRPDKTTSLSKQKRGYSIQTKNGLVPNQFYKAATHIFINPPFDQEKLDEKLEWAAGKVSMAAVFMEKAILYANPGTAIMAILPDVLRSGTRYQKWRNMLDKHCVTEKIELLGQFDEHADVDVYAIKLVKRQQPVENITVGVTEKTGTPKTLKDIFDVCVGPVVDYRDKKEGTVRPYVVSRGLKSWSIQREITLMRKHLGKSFERPFVVVKRTSRATDENRAMASIIDTVDSVYVDNHLIMLKPKTKTLAACHLAIKILKDKRTNDWLNEQIRCRHLTVKIVSQIPLWEK